MEIKPYSDEVKEAFTLIKEFQSGKKVPIKTRFDHFNKNTLGGIYNGNIITIAAISGVGKSYFLQLLEEDVFNKELNPIADEYILLRCNWEMSPFKLTLRALKNHTGQRPSDILFKAPDEATKAKYNEVYDNERNPRIYSSSIPSTPTAFYKHVSQFLEEHDDSASIVVTLDHIALVKDGGNKKKSMDDLLEVINRLRKEYPNVSFLIVSQLNREIESRTNPMEQAPRKSDLYTSDGIFQLADSVICLHAPEKLGLNRYMLVNPHVYPHLKEHMINPDAKTTNFKVEQRLFYHYLKLREADDHDLASRLFIEMMD